MSFIPTKTNAVQDELVTLELLDRHHAPLLFSAVDRNRQWLKTWLPWVNHMQTVENFTSYINRCKEQYEAGTDIGFVILVDHEAAGRIGIHGIDKTNKSASIGYWLGKEFAGRGIATIACRQIISLAFETQQLNRIEIRCAAGNVKSAAVAERLGFTKEGVLRQAEWVNGQALDLNLYSLLRKDWITNMKK